tara:strand:+ start:384 stop:674 length:291 start_codon:yes stop_codon:yes gene_type:complete
MEEKELNFDERKNADCIICDHIVNKERIIKVVTRDAKDGQWGFLCGETGHKTTNYKKIPLTEVIGIDESINDLFEIPLGHCATRKDINDKWTPFKL